MKRVVASENLLCLRAIDIFPTFMDKVDEHHKSLIVSHTPNSTGSSGATGTSPVNIHINTTHVHQKGHVLTKNEIQIEMQQDASNAVEYAWLIYLYFLAPNACYEVGVSHMTSRNIGRYMAVPRKEMFETTRNDIMSTFMHHFNSFLNDTSEYKELVDLVKNRYIEQLAVSGKNHDSAACITM